METIKLPVLESKNENSMPQLKIQNVAIKEQIISANFGKLLVFENCLEAAGCVSIIEKVFGFPLICQNWCRHFAKFGRTKF